MLAELLLMGITRLPFSTEARSTAAPAMTQWPMTVILMMMPREATTLREMLSPPFGMNVSARITFTNHDQASPSNDQQGYVSPICKAHGNLDCRSYYPSTLIFINL